MSNIIKETLIKIKEIKLQKKKKIKTFEEINKNINIKNETDLRNEKINYIHDYKEEYVNNPFQENIHDIILLEKVIDLNNYIQNYNVSCSDEMKTEIKFLRDKLNNILDK